MGHFCPPGSGSAIWMRIWIQQLKLMRIRIRIRNPDLIWEVDPEPPTKMNAYTLSIYQNTIFLLFWRARVCWLLLCFCRPFCILARCLDSKPESCRSKKARYKLSHPSLLTSLWLFIFEEWSILASWRSLTNITGSGFGSDSVNVTDPEHYN